MFGHICGHQQKSKMPSGRRPIWRPSPRIEAKRVIRTVGAKAHGPTQQTNAAPRTQSRLTISSSVPFCGKERRPLRRHAFGGECCQLMTRLHLPAPPRVTRVAVGFGAAHRKGGGSGANIHPQGAPLPSFVMAGGLKEATAFIAERKLAAAQRRRDVLGGEIVATSPP